MLDVQAKFDLLIVTSWDWFHSTYMSHQRLQMPLNVSNSTFIFTQALKLYYLLLIVVLGLRCKNSYQWYRAFCCIMQAESLEESISTLRALARPAVFNSIVCASSLTAELLTK